MHTELAEIPTVPSVGRTGKLQPGVHVEGWRGPNGELVVVPIGNHGRIAVPQPIYVNTPAELLRIREQFDRGELPGQTQFPPFVHNVVE